MILYKAVIQSDSPFVSPLQSDTFFGAFCWKYREVWGNDELEELLQNQSSDNPVIVFSNAFPHNLLPRPLGVIDSAVIRPGLMKKDEARKSYAQNKKVKSMPFIHEEGFKKIQAGTWKNLAGFYESKPEKLDTVIRTSVKRTSGTEEEKNRNLFSVVQHVPPEGQLYDLYILTELDRTLLEPVLADMLLGGIGGRKSVGKGAFHLISLDECTSLLNVPEANGYIALSNFIPAKDDPNQGWYKLLTKNGKLDRKYGRSGMPFKKPLLMIEAGAMFYTDQNRLWYGSIMRNVSAIPNVVTNACTIALPVCIPDQAGLITSAARKEE